MSDTVPDGTVPDGVRTRKMLLVASSGGHIAQLVRLAPGLGASDDSVWVSFDTPQVRSLLAGRRVVYVPYVRPRDLKGVVKAARIIRGLLRSESFDLVVSTGAAVAIAALPLAKAARIPRLYIETVSRVNAPSMTGRIVERFRLAETRTQHPHWAGGRWTEHPSVFTTFERYEKAEATDTPAATDTPEAPDTPQAPDTLFVTLGTIEGYRFDAIIDAVLATGLANENTVWQTGYTTGRTDLPGRVYAATSAAEFERFSTSADVVISHSGVGSILGFLELGVYPLIVPRRRSRKEHVDDHQTQIAAHVAKLGISEVVEAPDLTAESIRKAARYAVRQA